MTLLVDVLCHLELMQPDEQHKFLERARLAGVSEIICAGTDPSLDEDAVSCESIRAAQGSPRVRRALGLHPSNVPSTAFSLQEKLAILEQKLGGEDIVALGECGLDRRSGQPDLLCQRRAFTAQLRLARKYDLPILIHCVRAFGALLEVLDQERGSGLHGVVHGFTGAPETVQELVRRDIFISFGHRLCSPRATKAREAAKVVPAHALLLETDGPESGPEDLHGLISTLAELRGVSAEEIILLTSENARRMLGLPPSVS
ncbi:MAG: TatD family hydrolase [Myxococcota bacterium]